MSSTALHQRYHVLLHQRNQDDELINQDEFIYLHS